MNVGHHYVGPRPGYFETLLEALMNVISILLEFHVTHINKRRIANLLDIK
jgi:hypothetical protein